MLPLVSAFCMSGEELEHYTSLLGNVYHNLLAENIGNEKQQNSYGPVLNHERGFEATDCQTGLSSV